MCSNTNLPIGCSDSQWCPRSSSDHVDLSEEDPAGEYEFLLKEEFPNGLQNGLSSTKFYTRNWEPTVMGQIQPTACFYTAYANYGFWLFFIWLKNMLKTQYFVMCDNYWYSISVSTSEVLLEPSHVRSFTYCVWLLLLPQRQRCKTLHDSQSLKYLSTGPLQKVCQPLSCTINNRAWLWHH